LDKIFLIDGNSLLYRAFFATRLFTNSDGFPTNALYGLSSMIIKILDEKPKYIVAAFDTPKKTFRHEMFEDYKAHRKPPAEELILQMQPARDLLRAFGITVIENPGYEADDIIGTIAKKATNQNIHSCIYTGDLDSLQLIDNNIDVYHTVRGVTDISIYNADAVLKRYGIPVDKMVDYKGLKGDPSDNIPGVPGIGDKTATNLINEYGTIENILDNVDKMKEGKVKKTLSENKEIALLSKTLGIIDINVPMEFEFDKWEYTTPDYDILKALFIKYQFRSLLNYIDPTKLNKEVETPEIKNQKEIVVENKKDFEELLNNIKKEKEVSIFFDYSPDTTRFFNFNIFSPTLGFYNINMEEQRSLLDIIVFDEAFNININDLKDLLEDDNIKKIVFDSKNLIKILEYFNIDLKGIIFDTHLASYIKDPARTSYSIKDLAFNVFGVEQKDNAYVNYKLYKELYEDLKKTDTLDLLINIEIPNSYVLSNMEITGIELDCEYLKNLSNHINDQLNDLSKEIYKISGAEFNIASPKQLGEILFDKLEIPYPEKSNKHSTGIEILEKLTEYEIINKIITFRELSKIKSTYTDTLINLVNKNTGRLHTTFNQTVTSTGRLSSSNPNLQNIPIKSELGREVRKAFVSAKEHTLISTDYSQIEFRIFAHITKDEWLINAFKAGIDFHTATAATIYGVSEQEVTSDMRRNAKTMNFAILYGMADFTLSKQLGISVKEAKEFIEKYFARFPKVKETKELIIANAERDGYVSTITGRRSYTKEINSGNRMAKLAAERAAVNMPFQGSAADIMKVAMNNLFKRLNKEYKTIKILLQVHDELVCECPDDLVNVAAKIISEEMENAYQLLVPLDTEVKIGKNWTDMNKLDL